MAEMLLQSQADEIHLLPALPSSWTEGSIRGLCARGGVEVSISWDTNKLASASLRGKTAGNHAVRYGQNVIQVSVVPGRSVTVRADDFA